MGIMDLCVICNVVNFVKFYMIVILFWDFVKVVVLLVGKESIV